jgi:hypothetical protein
VFSESFEALAYFGPAAPGWVVPGTTPVTVAGRSACGEAVAP